MLTHPTHEALSALRLDGMAEAFAELITEDRGRSLVGGCGISPDPEGQLEMGYWIARPYWGLGFATEAGRQLIRIARAMHMPRLAAGHFTDNPASGAVLRKLGFRPTGRVAQRYSLARGGVGECALFGWRCPQRQQAAQLVSGIRRQRRRPSRIG